MFYFYIIDALNPGFSRVKRSRCRSSQEVNGSPTLFQPLTVQKVVRIAAKQVAPALGLASIHDETDLRVSAEDRIVREGKFWWMKYRLPKKNVSDVIDCVQAQRVLQRAILSVLDTVNPGGFEKVRILYGNTPECIIQVDLPVDFDEYLYVSCTFANNAYFDEKYNNSDGQGSDGEVYDNEF